LFVTKNANKISFVIYYLNNLFKENPALISKIEKYFYFSKMDKKNVQISKTRILYGKWIAPYDK
jgi:hypothetical protein